MEHNNASTIRPLVIGIGNAMRSDDAVGIKVLQRLRRHPFDADFKKASGDAASLIATWQDYGHVIVIDAADMGETPGTVKRIDAVRAELPTKQMDVSSHGFGLAQAIELARAINRLPARLIVFAIQAGSFDEGQSLSAQVKAAIPKLERQILQELKGLQFKEAH